MDSRIDTEKTRKLVALMTDKIRTEADIRLLDEYQKLFKKEVPLFNRSRVAAYMLMLVEQGKPLRPEYGNESRASGRNAARGSGARNDRRTARAARKSEGDESARYPLADEDAKWLFFSAGRSRRVVPRDILGLVNLKTALPKEDIGAIRIFDNYSFVQVRDSSVETIMEALNGHIFRGRPLVVNFAKSRKDEADNRSDDSQSDDGFSDARPADGSDGPDQHEDEHSKEEDV